MVGWPSGPRRQFQALVSSEAWVRIPLQSYCLFFCPKSGRLGPIYFCSWCGRGRRSTRLDGRAVQGASLRHWSLRSSLSEFTSENCEICAEFSSVFPKRPKKREKTAMRCENRRSIPIPPTHFGEKRENSALSREKIPMAVRGSYHGQEGAKTAQRCKKTAKAIQ